MPWKQLTMSRFHNSGEPLQEYDASQEVTAVARAEEAERRSSIIGLTAAGEPVHANVNDVGASAVVQWSSPVERGPQIRSHARRVLSASSSDGKYGEQNETEEEEWDSIFTPGDCLRFQLTFGEGPVGLKLAGTKAEKGVYVHDFTQIQTKSGPVATAAELSGRVRIGDLIVRVGSTDVSFSPADVVQDLLNKVRLISALVDSVTGKPMLQLLLISIFTPQTAFNAEPASRHRLVRALPALLLLPGGDARPAQGAVLLRLPLGGGGGRPPPRTGAAKRPCAFVYLERYVSLSDQINMAAGQQTHAYAGHAPPPKQAKVMLLIESDQYKSQHKNMMPASRTQEAKRIYDKFFDPRSHFDVSADVTPEVLEALKGQCCSPALALAAAPEPYPEAFDAARLLIQEDILRGIFPGFHKSTAHQRMLGFLARSPELVPLDPMDVLADDDMRHYFMLYLMSNRCVLG